MNDTLTDLLTHANGTVLWMDPSENYQQRAVRRQAGERVAPKPVWNTHSKYEPDN